nr:hypothetical protein [Tanacetum cinerariifolium]
MILPPFLRLCGGSGLVPVKESVDVEDVEVAVNKDVLDDIAVDIVDIGIVEE